MEAGLAHRQLGFRKGMVIASLNINGLRGKFDEIQLLMHEMGLHILALNETKLDPSYSKQLTTVAGFQQQRLDRTCNGGGVAIYIRDSIKYKIRDDVPIDNLELICIEVQPPRAKSFLVVAWYRPPGDPVGSYDKLEKVISFLDKKDKEIILLGDTNCDLSQHSAEQPIDNNSKHMINLYDLFSFTQLIGEPTRVTHTTSTLIDHIATTDARNIVKSGVVEISMSDHFMVYCVRKFEGAVKKDHKIISTRSMKNFNEDRFLSEVAGICWENIFSRTDDINVLVYDWTTLFSCLINKHAPIRHIRVSEKYCPWINAELKQLIRTRDRIKKAAVRQKSQLLMNSYRQLRNKVNKLNISLKKQYFSEKILLHEGNMKESWRTINQLLNKRSKTTNIDQLNDNCNNITDKKELSETMNNFFCSVGKDLAEKIPATPNPLISGDIQLNSQNKKFHFQSVGVRDIREAISKLKTLKGFGNDTISSYFLKLAMPFIENSLVFLFNTSLETSLFPDCWKIARVTPIFKDGDRADKSNYRPISILPVISRLFEKIVFNQLYQYLNGSGFLCQNQSGFREFYSTVTCLLKNSDDWYSGLDTGHQVGLVFIDLKKAFDTVDHKLLCKKLKHYGVSDRELSWFESYLTDRKQYCRVGSVDSSIGKIEIGVPQGSCLGPLLFLVYINDLPFGVQNSTVSMYADDTSLYIQSKDITQLNEALNEDLESLDNWLKGNKLSLNVIKTQSMLMCTRPRLQALVNNGDELSLKIKNEPLDVVQSVKYLGVQVDRHLDWSDHTKAVTAKVSRAIGFLKYARPFIPFKTLKALYTSIVEPHFRYCCSVWGCCGSTQITKLQKLQNRAARIVTNSSYYSSGLKLVSQLGWKTIETLINEELQIMVYKSINGQAPQYLCDLLTKNSACTSFNLRNTSTDLRLPKMSSSNGQRCFSFRGAKQWNSLSAECKTASSLKAFKKVVA